MITPVMLVFFAPPKLLRVSSIRSFSCSGVSVLDEQGRTRPDLSEIFDDSSKAKVVKIDPAQLQKGRKVTDFTRRVLISPSLMMVAFR
jgi:hypothetical protein